ncbi:MAG: response regulator [Chitinophagaceae bacterium]|nr:MAG: response regulator [Chitinophagaceae bacterium]
MIIYTDDDETDLSIFIEIVENLGREVIAFQNPEDLLRRMELPPPDLAMLFLDINMPLVNGIRVLEIIRASPTWKMLPVVILSTTANHNYIQETQLLGANFYIVKPSNHEQLQKAIRYTLSIDWEKRLVTTDNFLYQP